MAERRMFTQKITESDAFLELPLTSQCLYFHLCMNADDDGFVNNPKRLMRMLGNCDDDIKILLAKRFLLAFESGVIVIKHWRLHNLLRKDRYTETEYQDEKKKLFMKKNGIYTLDSSQGKSLFESLNKGQKNEEIISEKPNGNQSATKWQPNGNQSATQYSIGKDSIDIYNERTNINKNNILSSACVCERVCACEGEEDSNEKPSEPLTPYPLKPLKSYDDVMDDCQVPIEVRPAVSEFIKHCVLNKHVLTNDKLMDILVTLDMQNTDNAGKIAALKAAISGGYYDVKHI